MIVIGEVANLFHIPRRQDRWDFRLVLNPLVGNFVLGSLGGPAYAMRVTIADPETSASVRHVGMLQRVVVNVTVRIAEEFEVSNLDPWSFDSGN